MKKIENIQERTNYLNDEKVMKVTQILHSKLLRKKGNEGMQDKSSAPSKNNVLDMQKES